MEPRTFRIRFSLRLAMVIAAAFWGAVLAALVRLPGVPAGTLLSASLFLLFFLGFSAHYGRMAVVVGPDDVAFVSAFRRVRVPWDEIVRVEVYAGIAGTLYAVLTRRGLVQFTSLLARHRELLDVLRERAGLARFR